MGKFHLPARYLVGLLCAAASAFPAVASTVSVDVSPTTGYSVTNRSTVALPPRTSSGPIANYTPTLGPLSGGGAYQTTSSGVTITGIKGTTASTTMSGRINAGAAAMRNGLTRCLTSARCNLALAGGAAGLQALLNGIDWVMEEGGTIKRIGPPPPVEGVCYVNNPGPCTSPYYLSDTLSGAVAVMNSRNAHPPTRIEPQVAGTWSVVNRYGTHIGNIIMMGSCSPPNKFSPTYGCGPETPSLSPVPPAEIPPAVDSGYSPDPTDLPYISTGGLDFGAPDVNFEITDIPSATGDSSSFTEYPDGTSKGTNTEFDFSWSNNPSKQPQVSVDETTTETTYSPTGEPTGTTTTTTTTTPTGGGGEPPNNEIEIPTDCDFMPTVCRFLEWFKEPDPELNQEPDFTQLIDTIDIEREFQVGTSTAACPAPFQISLAWVPSVEVSLQPFCDLADLLRPFLLSLCFLYSGMIILRT